MASGSAAGATGAVPTSTVYLSMASIRRCQSARRASASNINVMVSNLSILFRGGSTPPPDLPTVHDLVAADHHVLVETGRRQAGVVREDARARPHRPPLAQ